MNTKDLKNYINEVLGDSVRCLLPSFWWKKLFGEVVDTVESVEKSVEQKINNAIKDSNVPIVENESRLQSLNLPEGSLASVKEVGEYVSVNIEDCFIHPSGTGNGYEYYWDEYTIIRRVEKIGDVPLDDSGLLYFMKLIDGKASEYVAISKFSDSELMYVRNYERIEPDGSVVNTGGPITFESFNEYLASGDYRLALYLLPENNSNSITQYYTFYSEVPTTELYIKGHAWEKIAKESDILGGGSDNTDDSSENVIAFLTFGETEEAKSFNANAYQQYINFRGECPKVVVNTLIGGGYANVVTSMGPISNASEHQYITLIWCDFGGKMHETLIYSDGSVSDVNMEESIEIIYHRVQSPDGTKAHNAKIYQKMNNSFVLLLFNDASRNGNEIFCGTYGCSYIKLEDYFLIEVEDSINPRVFKLTSDGTLTFERRENYFDSELSDTSESAVKNKAIKAYVDSKVVELEARLSALENK